MLKVAICYVIMLIMAVVFYVAFIDTLSLLLLITAIVFPFVMLIIVALVRYKTEVGFVCEKTGESKNADIIFKIVLHNKTILPLPRVNIKVKYKNCMDSKFVHSDFLVPLHFGKTQTVKFSLSSMYCGRVDAYLENIVFYDYISLFRLQNRVQKKCSAYILPQIHDLDIVMSDNIEFCGENDKFSQYVAGDDASEVFSMRDYVPGDKLSQIHWKLSSKHDEFVVKEYSKPINSNVLFLCDFDCGINNTNRMRIADALAEAMISLSNCMVINGFEHYAAVFSCDGDNLEFSAVSDEESCVVLARKILSTRIYDEPVALKSFCALDEFKKYSHVIYLSNGIDAEKTAMLENVSFHVKTSAVTIDDRPYVDIVKIQSDFNTDLPFYAVECSNISACLSELIV